MLNFQIFGYYTLLHDTNEITLFFLDNFHYFRKLRPVRNWCATWILVLLGVQSLNCQTAKNSGEPQKMTHSLETEIFSRWSEWESCSPGCNGDMPCWKISRFQNKKIDFWPQVSKFLGKKSTFSPLAANWILTDQCFQHEKGVSLESRYKGTKIFTPCPQKIGFWAQKRPNLAQNWHFGPNIGIFAPFDLKPDQKTMQTSCLDGFLLCWYVNLIDWFSSPCWYLKR